MREPQGALLLAIGSGSTLSRATPRRGPRPGCFSFESQTTNGSRQAHLEQPGPKPSNATKQPRRPPKSQVGPSVAGEPTTSDARSGAARPKWCQPKGSSGGHFHARNPVAAAKMTAPAIDAWIAPDRLGSHEKYSASDDFPNWTPPVANINAVQSKVPTAHTRASVNQAQRRGGFFRSGPDWRRASQKRMPMPQGVGPLFDSESFATGVESSSLDRSNPPRRGTHWRRSAL